LLEPVVGIDAGRPIMSATDNEQDDWNEAYEPRGLGWFDEAGDLLAALVVGFVLGGIVYIFGI
jgi:hypothetical protein